MEPNTLTPADDGAVRALHQQVLAAWNQRQAEAYGALFAGDALLVGFDGSQMRGRAEIVSTLAGIFADHATGRYVGLVREVRALGPAGALLHAVAGLVPAGQTDLNPSLNAIQILVAARHAAGWHIVSLQNTPAQFHGRPHLVEALTRELRQLL